MRGMQAMCGAMITSILSKEHAKEDLPDLLMHVMNSYIRG